MFEHGPARTEQLCRRVQAEAVRGLVLRGLAAADEDAAGAGQLGPARHRHLPVILPVAPDPAPPRPHAQGAGGGAGGLQLVVLATQRGADHPASSSRGRVLVDVASLLPWQRRLQLLVVRTLQHQTVEIEVSEFSQY